MYITLVNPSIDNGYCSSLRTGVYPPLQLASLASYICNNNAEYELTIIDEEINPKFADSTHIHNNVVGISCNCLNYRTSIETALIAANENSKVILGGPYPSLIAETILEKHEFVDCIVTGDGEIALSKILQGEKYENIPNLVYRKGNRIIRNKEIKTDINTIPFPDYANLDLTTYFKNHQLRYSNNKPYKGSIPVYSMKGCEWRDRSKGGCSFCMVPHYGIRYKEPGRYWVEIEHLSRKYDINTFWDVSDSFTDNDKWLNELLFTKPGNLDINLQVYGRPSSLSDSKAALLNELGVVEVFIGVESGDDHILKLANKGSKVRNALKAIDHLSKYGINIIVSFVLGLEGETYESLNKTIDLATELAKHELINETSTSIIFPIPGSKIFNSIMGLPGMKEKYSSDIFNWEELKHDWLKNFTEVDMKCLQQAQEHIIGMFPLNNSFSRPKNEIYSSLNC